MMEKRLRLRGGQLLVCGLVLSCLVSVAFAAENLHDGVYSTYVAPNSQQGAGMESSAQADSQPYQGSAVEADISLAKALADITVTPEVAALIGALQPAKSSVGAESVLGSDSRIRTYTTSYPSRATALVTFDGGYCTGFFIGPYTVATTGHCVHSGKYGTWNTNVVVYPGYDNGSAPYGGYSATALASVVGWTRDGLENYDYGAIKLGTSIGNTVGWFGFWWQSAALDGNPATIMGYASDKSPSYSQWLSVDKIRATSEKLLFYKNDTYNGQSGSPIWMDRPTGSSYCVGVCAAGIHGYAPHGTAPNHSDKNHGIRMTQGAYNNYLTWKTSW